MLKWVSRLLPKKPTQAETNTTRQAPVAVKSASVIEGSARGWLKVLEAKQLLERLQANAALDALWRQSRLSPSVWERDLLQAIERYAEFVQLMPASESHHHAHAGGLIAHTLEMTLAAMTWRNGYFLPSGAQIEQIDEQRDVWTYVVFFAALLHDIAKPMTDLRISWRAARMTDAIRWTPIAGSLVQLSAGRVGPEYLVEFTPKSMRDYGAHSKLALTLLNQIAPPTALSFMAATPQAMDSLSQYLSGQDKTSLVARLVNKADQASTRKSLMDGSRARFDTATSVPLIELLMSAIKDMLKSGTSLPLNRTGAAGWVFDGSVWFVAKRLADAVRAWIHTRAPDEGIPGENKNDRLFDTWQEYGAIQLNPASGQAVWYVTVHGVAADGSAADAGYMHKLTMLRFPLERLYDDESQYPPSMAGRIEVLDKRAAKDEGQQENGASSTPIGIVEPTFPPLDQDDQTESVLVVSAESGSRNEASAQVPAASSNSSKAAAFSKPQLRAPQFNKPKPAAVSAPKAQSKAPKPAPAQRTLPGEISIGGVDGFDVDDDDLVDDQVMPPTPSKQPRKPADAQVEPPNKPALVPAQEREDFLGDDDDVKVAVKASPNKPDKLGRKPKPALAPKEHKDAPAPLLEPATTRLIQTPVVLTPSLPELPSVTAARKEPSEVALAFIQWLQQGLASREIKYNEAGAPVHFVQEGMALVSPLIFKLYAAETGPKDEADIVGLQVQREVIKAGWHRMTAASGSGKINILKYEVIGKGSVAVGKLSAVVLTDPDKWVLPVPPNNPVLKLS